MIVVGGGSIAHPFVSTPSSIPPQGVPLNLMPLVWKTEHGETRHDDIDDFTRKLANGRARSGGGGGGGGGGRGGSEEEDSAAAWLLESLDLPRTLNYLSTAAVLQTQDRCSKNWLLLQERDKENSGLSRWSLLAGDSKTALGADSGFGGESEHARDYALNHSDQFASPLFCDRGHPQDVEASAVEPWSGVVVEPLDASLKKQIGRSGGGEGEGGGERRRRRRRRSVLAAPEEAAAAAAAPAATTVSSASGAPRIEPPPADRPAAPMPLLGCAADTTQLARADGSPRSTFNPLVDALLRCPATRSMFLRRCQTLTGQLHGASSPPPSGGGPQRPTAGGALLGIVGNLTSAVAADAARDNEVWRGGDPALGSRQLLEEQIPGRARQLQEAYGKGGYVADGLLPPPQPAPLPASAVRVVVFPPGSSPPSPSSPPPSPTSPPPSSSSPPSFSPSSSSSSSSSSSPCSPSSSLPRLQFRTNVSNVKDFHIYCKLHGLSDRTCWFLMETFLLKYRQYFLAAQKEQVQILTSNGGGGGGGGAKNRHDQFTFWPICADKQFYLLSTYHLCESNLDRLGDHFWFLLSKQQLLSLVHKDELDFDSLTVCFGDRVWNKLMNFQVIDI